MFEKGAWTLDVLSYVKLATVHQVPTEGRIGDVPNVKPRALSQLTADQVSLETVTIGATTSRQTT